MSKLKIRVDDEVVVITGKDRGKRGRVLRTEPGRERVYIEGLNMIKRHTKPTPQGGQGGVIEREGPIHVSNVMLIDPKDDRPTRVGIVREGSERYRVARRSGSRLD
jgi:large subunit ribosomal protein L24